MTHPTVKKTFTPAHTEMLVAQHRKAIKHLLEAIRNHQDAILQYELGEHEKATQFAVSANGHQSLAVEAQRDDRGNYVLNR